MKFNPDKLKVTDTQEIVNTLISHVTKTDEEVAEERKERRRSTELKVFIADNSGFTLGSLDDRLVDLYESEEVNKNIRGFIDSHTFQEEKLNEDVSYLEIHTPNYGRTDQFVLIDKGGYLRVLTAERRYWTKRTIEKLIKYLPELDRVFLSPADLESMVGNLEDTDFSGFTAKHKPYYSEKELSIQFHGGEKKDLEKVEEEFQARPTRVEFSQRNSPSEAVEGAVRQDGYYSIPSIRKGSEQKGYETIMSLSTSYERRDRQNFAVEHKARDSFDDGFTIEGYTTVKFVEESEETSEFVTDGGDATLADELESEILDRKRRYKYSNWDEGDFLVFDTKTREPFQVGIDGNDLAIHAKPATTAKTLREFGHIILDEFNSTYRFEKYSDNISA